MTARIVFELMLVTKIRRIVEELGHEIATPNEARAMLALKGADGVGFRAS